MRVCWRAPGTTAREAALALDGLVEPVARRPSPVGRRGPGRVSQTCVWKTEGDLPAGLVPVTFVALRERRHR